MKAFDVVEDIRPRFCPRAVLTPVDALSLEQARYMGGDAIEEPAIMGSHNLSAETEDVASTD